MQAPQATSPFHERTPLRRLSDTMRTLTATSGSNFIFLHHALLVVAISQRLGMTIHNSMYWQQRRHGQARLGAAYLRRGTQRSSHRRSGMVCYPGQVTNDMGWLQVAKLSSHNSIAVSNPSFVRKRRADAAAVVQQIENGRAARLIEVFA